MTAPLRHPVAAETFRDRAWWAEKATRAGTDWFGIIRKVLEMKAVAPCDTCGRQPCATPSFCQRCREADATAKTSQRHRGKSRPTPKPTIEALVFALRRGVSELTKPDTLRRVSALDPDQLKEVCRRVQAFNREIATAWTTEELATLKRIWGKSR